MEYLLKKEATLEALQPRLHSQKKGTAYSL